MGHSGLEAWRVSVGKSRRRCRQYKSPRLGCLRASIIHRHGVPVCLVAGASNRKEADCVPNLHSLLCHALTLHDVRSLRETHWITCLAVQQAERSASSSLHSEGLQCVRHAVARNCLLIKAALTNDGGGRTQLKAVGVFAFLHPWTDHRFVLGMANSLW